MLCEQCKQNQATIHITRVVNGERTEMNLCADCAKEYGASALGEISSLFSGLLEGGTERVQAAAALRCPRCGLGYDQFKKTGMLGCANCYVAFRKQLQPVLQRIHGRLQHEGHIPISAGAGLRLRRQIEVKRREMQSAIDQEEFERAAKLRDELRGLQTKLEAQDSIKETDKEDKKSGGKAKGGSQNAKG